MKDGKEIIIEDLENMDRGKHAGLFDGNFISISIVQPLMKLANTERYENGEWIYGASYAFSYEDISVVDTDKDIFTRISVINETEEIGFGLLSSRINFHHLR